MKKRYWLGIAISLLLVYLLFRSVELAKVVKDLQEANLVYLLPALGIYFLGVLVRTARWSILMKRVGRVPSRRLFVVLVIGFMANDILPLRAGEVVRAFMLWWKERLEPGATLGTIVVERIFDGLALICLLLIAGLAVSLDDQLRLLAWAAGAVFVAGILAVFALTLVPKPLLNLAEKVLSPFPERLSSLALRLLHGFVGGLGILRSARETVAVMVLSVGAWVLEAGMYFILMFSFSFTPRFSAAFLGTAVANLAAMVPSSPGYVGTFDWGLSKALEVTYRVDPSEALAYTGLVHAALIVPVVLLGLLFLWREGLSLKRLTGRDAYASVRGDAGVMGQMARSVNEER